MIVSTNETDSKEKKNLIISNEIWRFVEWAIMRRRYSPFRLIYTFIMIRFAVDDAINSPIVRNHFKYNNEQG